MNLYRISSTVIASGLLFLNSVAWSADTPDTDLEENFSKFIKVNGIQSWPRLAYCGYEYPFSDKTVGIILEIITPTMAIGRWDSGCIVPVEHTLTGWPDHLQPGKYVVAVTSTGRYDSSWKNHSLHVIGVFGTNADCTTCIDFAIKQICSTASVGDNNDQICERK